ncbi:MAG: hypothetical protein A3C90_04635 [Candidatus Magasanikbacteria bacterium RIFCSPHIGHO2_02_FULL_51_14]|uniref:Uncharacterized protein n=1 Tax=Candidatus Magasanikbacteria bacterium RIFCSPHIGHO2_02_FULL_51_14 TaxID=1798683 RepID=A0A1F6MQI0_9BACT|nr:MAG: hypothetical protein A3C90_04635 [Candidatus Magasanikbacteria bacterium RIFCSPHIGHO2_02_FULL_51_14]
MKRILWMSRHTPTERQISELARYLGDEVEVEQEPRPFDDARQIVRRFRQGGYDEMVIVAPLSVIAVVCTEGVKPLWSEAGEENDPAKIEFRGARGQGYRFVRFRRIMRVALEFED